MAKSLHIKRPRSPSQRPLSPPPVRRKIESTTTSSAVASFFKPASQKEPELLRWRIVNQSLIVGRYGPEAKSGGVDTTLSTRRKVAAFDFDDTLISSTSGHKFTRSASGWKWWDAGVPSRLKQLHREGYLLVILSNQGNISLRDDAKVLQKDSTSLANFKGQVTAVLRQLDLPISIYAATMQDQYRKPRTGMWQEMKDDHDLDGTDVLDLGASFLVGDAAGRAKIDTRRKDHACSDRDLASNIGIGFHTPEEFFLKTPPEPFLRDFAPKEILDSGLGTLPASFFKRNPQDVVLFCGSPGAGKSTFYWEHLKPLGYERINQDILKTRERCLKVARDLLTAGESVAVDNTNANPETRAYWTQLAREFKIPIRCVLFTAPPRLCEHNDCVRALNKDAMNPEKRSLLPAVAFRSFVQRYSAPSLEEGFQDIIPHDFLFQGSTEHRQIWSRYWVSKFST